MGKGWGEEGKLGLVEALVAGMVLAKRREGEGDWQNGAWGTMVRNSLAAFLRLVGEEEGREAGEEILKKNLNVLLPILLHFSSSSKGKTPILAIDCLIKLSKVKEVREDRGLLIRISEGLNEGISSERRDVRAKSVEARNLFILLTSETKERNN